MTACPYPLLSFKDVYINAFIFYAYYCNCYAIPILQLLMRKKVKL